MCTDWDRLSVFSSLSVWCVSGRFQESWCRCSGQEDSAGGSAVGSSAGYPPGSAGLSGGSGTWIPFRYQQEVSAQMRVDVRSLLSSADSGRGLCLSEACVTVASQMVEAMDRSADPCHDFYQFACGGWMRKNPLPDGRSHWSTFNSIGEQNQALLKHLLGETRVGQMKLSQLTIATTDVILWKGGAHVLQRFRLALSSSFLCREWNI